MTPADLRARQSNLEAEIAGLRSALRVAEGILSKEMRATTRRGFWAGFFAGGALVSVALVSLAVAAFVSYVRFMSHMG